MAVTASSAAELDSSRSPISLCPDRPMGRNHLAVGHSVGMIPAQCVMEVERLTVKLAGSAAEKVKSRSLISQDSDRLQLRLCVEGKDSERRRRARLAEEMDPVHRVPRKGPAVNVVARPENARYAEELEPLN
jgi:hypothetical protein